MYFLIEDDDLLEKCNIFWYKVISDIKKEFDSRSVYYKKTLKTKIKSYSDETTYFYNEEIPNINSNHTCLAVVSLDSALDKDGNYYPQVFLEECKYTEKEKKVVRHINEDLRDFLYSSECDA